MSKYKVMHFVCGIKSGGVEQVLYNYISRMDKTKFENYIVYQHEPESSSYKKLDSVCEEMIRIPSKRKHPIKNIKESRRIIRKIKPDIVHCHMSKSNFFALIPAKKENVKVRINHSHAAIVQTNFMKKMFFVICDKLNCKYSTHHMACGEEAAKSIYKSKKDKRNISILLNKIDDKIFAYNEKNRKEIRKKLNIMDDEKIIGTIGRMELQKNQSRLIDIFKQVHDKKENYKLIIIGKGSLKEKIAQKIEEYNLKNSVILLDPISDVYKYYSAFDCFVLPSLYEGLPVTSIEAQFNEVPIILSDTVASSAKLTEYVKFFSLNESDEKWANLIINEAESSRTKKGSTEVLYSQYSLNEEKNMLEDEYDRIVGNNNEKE